MPVLERSWEGDAFCAETITKFATNVTLTTKHSQCYNCYFPFIFSGLANTARISQYLVVDDDYGNADNDQNILLHRLSGLLSKRWLKNIMVVVIKIAIKLSFSQVMCVAQYKTRCGQASETTLTSSPCTASPTPR